MLHLYVDSADRSSAQPLLATGIFRGLATNPVLWERADVATSELPALYEWATSAGAQEVFLQAWGPDEPTLSARAEELLAIGPAVVVKVPATLAGTSVAARLAREGHPVLLTAVYNPAQALLAAAAGVTYVAPYFGRMDEAGRDAFADVGSMQRALDAVGSHTRILAASLRRVSDVVRLAELGVRCFALAPPVAHGLFDEPLTATATADFERAAQVSSR
jgi:transaldolase